MVQSVNSRQTLEVFLTIAMGIAILLNVNSFANGVGQATDSLGLGEKTEQLFSTLADAGSNAQQVSEDGAVQTLFASVTGGEARAAPAENSGNIGEWIEMSGSWVVGLFSPTEQSVTTQFATVVNGAMSAVPEPLVEASGEFDHLSRPMVSNVSIDEELVEEFRKIRASMATMIMIY